MDPQRRLNILQIVSGTDVNGALVHCKLLIRELAARGHKVTLACRRNSWLWNQLDDIPIRLVSSEMSRWPPIETQRFARWVQRQQFDVMHTHMSRAHLYGIIMKRLTGVPVVATAHSRHIQPHWRWNDQVIANSEVTFKYHRRFNRIPKSKIQTIPCFIDEQKFTRPEKIIHRAMRREWRFDMDSQVLAIAGDVVPHKGHFYLFQCLPELMQRFPKLRLVVVGRFNRQEKYTHKLRTLQLENDLTGRVRWLGRRNDMHHILAAANATIIPSIVEAQGLVALESMAVGTPVIAAASGGLVELIDHEVNGLLVPAKDPSAISEAVTRLLNDDQLNQRLVDGGIHCVDTTYSTNQLVARVEEVLSRSASNKNQLRHVA